MFEDIHVTHRLVLGAGGTTSHDGDHGGLGAIEVDVRPVAAGLAEERHGQRHDNQSPVFQPGRADP